MLTLTLTLTLTLPLPPTLAPTLTPALTSPNPHPNPHQVRKKTHGSGSAGPTAPKKADGLSSGTDVADSYTALPGLDGAPRP